MPKEVQKSLELHKNTGIVTLAVDLSKKNKYTVYSCGTDDCIGVWTIDEDEGRPVYDVQNCANKLHGVLAIYGETFYVGETIADSVTGNQKQAVVKYIRDEFIPSTPIMTFIWEISALALSSDGRYLVAGSSDFKVKCIDLEQKETGFESFECDGHIVNLSIDPKCTFFAVSSSDGNVQIRTLAKESDNFKKPISVFKACSGFKHITHETSRMQISWLSSGERIFIPSIGKVIVVNCMNWREERGLYAPDCNYKTFSVTDISENDQFFVACTTEGTMAVWLIEGLQLYKTINVSLDGIVTSLVFNPANDGSVILAYSKGYLGLVKNATVSKACNKLGSPQMEATKRISSSMSVDNHDELGDFEDMETDLGFIKSQHGFAADGSFNPSAAGVNIQHSNESTNPISNGLTNYALKNIIPAKVEPSTTIKKMKVQRTFCSGSTPSNQEQGYLMWNTFGVIKSFKTPTESTIEIAFHDITVHSEIIVDNAATDYVLGDINNNLVALASHSNLDRDSELMVHHINAWDIDSRQWNLKMPEGESVECLSVGSEFIAVCTDRRFLRIFSPAGTQRNVISTGPVLTISASVSTLVIVRSTGAVLITENEEYEHQLSAEIFGVNTASSTRSVSKLKSIPLALGEGAQLKWISFSNVGNLVTMDCQCTIRLFTLNNFWQPIFVGSELLKDADADYIWPIAVMEKPSAMFRYVYCKGMKHPIVSKNMVPLTVPWEVPIANPEAERSKLESQIILNELMQSALKSYLKEDPSLAAAVAQLGQENLKTIIKLFAISCKSGRECRAAELANLTTDSHGIQILCTYAAKSQRPNLSEKVAAIGRNRMGRESNDASLFVESADLIQFSLASSSSVNTSETITLAPSNKLIPKKNMLKARKSALNVLMSTNESGTVSKDLDEKERNASTLSNFPIPTTSLLEDSILTDDSINFFAPPTPSLNSDVVVSAKNPFKRTEATERIDKADNIMTGTTDFFEQLTAKRTKLIDSSSAGCKNLNDALASSKKASKKESKLVFNNSKNVLEDHFKSTTNNANKSSKKVTGFDLWREESKIVLLQSYDGPKEEFQTHMVRQFRMLTSEEKKKWNDAAKST